MTMTEVDAFLEAVVPTLIAAETTLHDGDATQRIAMWSRHDPLTLFGAAVTTQGWESVLATFDWLGSTFSNCTSYTYEVVAAGASGDLAYLVGIERTTASLERRPPASYSLRSTTIFRREDGAWRVVHRHGDPFDDSAGPLLAQLDLPSLP